MARNTTGLRRGAGPGRPPGSRNKVSGDFKKALRDVFEEIHTTHPTLIRRAVEKGLRARPPGSFQYLQLALAYSLGKPANKLELSGQVELPTIINHFHGDADDA